MLSLTDGGSLSAPENNIPVSTVRWLASTNYVPGGFTVKIELSRDGGASWDIVATGIDGSTGAYLWVNTNFSSSFNSLWRVTDEASTNIASQTQVPFTFRNGAFEYFINDNSTNGNVYTTAVGLPGNSGSTPSSPKDSLAGLLNDLASNGRSLLPGDKVFIDTGAYTLTNTITVSTIHAGQAGVPVLIYGSTNAAAGGTVFNRNSTTADGMVVKAGYWQVSDLAVRNARSGLVLTNSAGSELIRLQLYDHIEDGLRLEGSSTNVVLRHSVVRNNLRDGVRINSATASIAVDHAVLWSNARAALRVVDGAASFSNGVIVASGPSASCYQAVGTNRISGNFNDLYTHSNAVVAVLDAPAEQLDSVARWQQRTGQDGRSLSVDPLFANPAAGDFHLKTQTAEGRYDPLLGAFVNDGVTSLLIDSGDPGRSVGLEPTPNGSRVDIGLYGGTAEASKSRSVPWLHAASLANGGVVQGTATLAWVAGNFTNGALVRLEASRDGGYAWSLISNEVLAAAGSIPWDTTAWADSPAGRWRVVSLDDTNLVDAATNLFSIRNAPLSLYLNDGATTGDVYSAAAGSATNWEASAARPFHSLAQALRLYDLEPGDTVYLDTGSYAEATNSVISRVDGGYTGQVVRFIGTTQTVAGSVLDRGSSSSNAVGLMISDAGWVSLSNLTFRGGGLGVVVTNSSDLSLSIRAWSNAVDGFAIANSTNVALRRASAVANQRHGFSFTASTNLLLEHAVAWSNQGSAIYLNASRIRVTNSVLTAHASGRYLYEAAGTNESVTADFNDLLVSSPAQAALLGGRSYRFLSNLQMEYGADTRSLSHAPAFADPAAGNFYLQSTAGRWLPGAGWVTDAVHSVLIDAGAPGYSVAAEPPPNGGRANLGLHGGTGQASLSDTNGSLLALTLHDGGSIRGTNTLYWLATGPVTGHLVFLDFSADGGLSWTNLATNLQASAGSFTWNTTLYPSTVQGVWRITSQSNTAQVGQTSVPFTLNNGALTYYVNDTNTAGDVYCSAPGNSVNDGASPATPLPSVALVLDRYTLGPGDRVLLDTGVYAIPNGLTLGSTLQGLGTNRIVIQGSTNSASGGTVLDTVGGHTGVLVQAAASIKVHDVRIRGARFGLSFTGATNSLAEGVLVEGGKGFNVTNGLTVFAFTVSGGSNIQFRNCAAVGVTNDLGSGAGLLISSSSNVVWDGGVMWSNKVSVQVNSGNLLVSNSTFTAIGKDSLVYYLGLGTAIRSDYNNYDLRSGAQLGRGTTSLAGAGQLPAPVYYNTLDGWSRATGNDQNSLSHDPLFASPPDLDFHLSSQGGRWVGTGVVFDAVTSPLIDAGDPAAAFTNEPAPHGGRRNIGRFGDTGEASRTPTNGRLVVLTFNQGGIAAGTNVTLRWLQTGLVTNHLKQVDLSLDYGSSWLSLASNLPAGATSYTWNSTNRMNQPGVHWRVMSQAEPLVQGVTAVPFAIRNSNVVYYVNDAATTGDVFCSTAGSEFYTGLAPHAPKSQVAEILEAYDVEPGDTIYVDTGTYTLSSNLVVRQYDGGEGTNFVRIAGSTNLAAGGTRWIGGTVTLDATRATCLQDIRLQVAGATPGAGVVLNTTSNSILRRVRLGGNVSNGIEVRNAVSNVLERCEVVGAASSGLYDLGSRGTYWHQGVLWSNLVAVKDQSASQGLTVRHSILSARSASQAVYEASSSLTADFNAVWVTNNALVARRIISGRPYPSTYDTLGSWTRATGQDVHSLSLDPWVAGAPTNFYLLSQAGRYQPETSSWVTDTVSSLLIDAGDPVAAFSQEPPPNGGRINIGPQGDAPEASRSPTQAVLQVVSLNDGGIASGTNVYLYWIAHGAATGMAVRIQYSPDQGLTWSNVVTNVAPGLGSYAWNSTGFPSSVLGLWRVVSEADANVTDTSDAVFALRNGPVYFYVNDAVTSGDIYCLTPGHPTNSGVSASVPAAALQDIIDRYDLEGGDVVYVDTGVYTNLAPIQLSQNDAGIVSSNAWVTIQGSTNLPAGGTVLVGSSVDPVVNLIDLQAVSLRDLSIVAGVGSALRVQQCSDLAFERVLTRNGAYGYSVSTATGLRWTGCQSRNHTVNGLVLQNATSCRWEQGLFWSNGAAAVRMTSSSAGFSNTVFGMLVDGAFAYEPDLVSVFSSDYNALFATNGGMVARQRLSTQVPAWMEWPSVARWARATGRDLFSYAGDPLFVDALAGNFQLRSEGGRRDVFTGALTNDAASSPLLDAGSPLSPYANEPQPNGGRVNIGPFGNSSWASMTATQAVLQVVSLNDGGRAEGSGWPLYWLARGGATGHTVRVEFAGSTADVWTVVASNLTANRTVPLNWNTLAHTSTPLALWRVVSEMEPGVTSTSAFRFAVRNEPLSFYVNDGSSAGDVFTSVAGSPLFTGTQPDQPRDDLQKLLDDYDLDPGDTVYMDTGTYDLSGETVTWSRFDGWENAANLSGISNAASRITLQGSTNDAAGGTTIRGFQGARIIYLDRVLGVSLKDLTVRQLGAGAGNCVEWRQASYGVAERVRVYQGSRGFFVNDSDRVTFSQCIAVANGDAGLATASSDGTLWTSGVLWSNRYGVYQGDSGAETLQIRNTLLGSFNDNQLGYYKYKGNLYADYNHFYLLNGALPAQVAQASTIGGGTGRFETVSNWSRDSGQDAHSLAENPHVAGTADFHPQSPAGRYAVGSGYGTNLGDAVSPMIDAGDPAGRYDLETAPNGGRLDIGAYGNSAQSSLSPTNARLTILSLNDGGSAAGTFPLNWVAGGDATGHLLRIEYSGDGGLSWSVLASNIAAASGTYTWNSVPYGRSSLSTWRLISQQDPSLADQSASLFTLRNGGSFAYYVNDSSLAGDVYCTAAGNDSNTGISPSSPKATLKSVLDTRDLEPGDVVYIDTGLYPLGTAVVVGEFDAGAATNRVIFQGSTNLAAGGTVFDRQTGGGDALHLQRTAGIEIRKLKIINAARGVFSEDSGDCYFEDIRVENCSGAAFAATKSVTNYYLRCSARLTGSGLSPSQGKMVWRNGVVWDAAKPVDVVSGGSVEVYNSVFRASGALSRIFSLSVGAGNVAGNFNVYVCEGGALFYERTNQGTGNELYLRLSDWQQASGQDLQSAMLDPLFNNPALGDFHPRSAAGRYLDNGVLTNDAAGIYSPLLDAGDPIDTAWTNEAAPNGGRLNIGMYGGTALASLSNTNPWLRALTFNEGGTISGIVTVSWSGGGFTNGARVRLEQALDGVEYLPFASNLLASAGSHPWNVASAPVSPFARWRVVWEDNPSVMDANDQSILIKNERLVIYVNDDNSSGDVYTSAPGSATNTGRSASSPLRAPDDALSRYTLGPGDVLYVDTGSYPLTNEYGLAIGLVGNQQDVGFTNNPASIVGSTNYDAGGSLLIPAAVSNAVGIWINNTAFVDVENFAVESASGDGVVVIKSADVNLRRIESARNGGRGFYVQNRCNINFDRCAAWGNTNYGFEVAGQSSVGFNRGVVWSNQAGAVHANGAIWAVSNSVLAAFVTNTYVVRITADQGQVAGDYNIYQVGNGARIGYRGVQQQMVSTLRGWQVALGIDVHSAYVDPLFHAPEVGDFHLRSAAGRYDASVSNFVTIDADTSWAIDAGNPAAAYTNEPMPNGGRLNVGLHGDSPEASKSVTNGAQRALQVISFDDGGQLTTNITLRWFARGFQVGEDVNLDFSQDAGVSWQVLATNVSAISGEYLWVPAATNSTPVGYWRVSSADGAPAHSTNAVNFAVRLVPVNYFVNDTSTVGDVYCTAVGSSTNNGLSPAHPADSLNRILESYDLEPADKIWVDTGVYLLDRAQVFLADDSGIPSSYVEVLGSTNLQAGGSILDRQSTNLGATAIADAGLDFQSISNVVVSHLTIQNANNGITGYRPQSVLVRHVAIRDGGVAGISLSQGNNITFSKTLVTRMLGVGASFSQMTPTLDSVVIWSNRNSALSVSLGSAYVTNSVLHAYGSNYCFDLFSSSIRSDFNNLHFTQHAYPIRYRLNQQPAQYFEAIPQWTAFSTQDLYSVNVDPLFADAAANDFHPQSPYGRFDPASNAYVTGDAQLSYLVDAGPPSYAYALEPDPNGGRRNMGLYGDTAEASKSYTGEWVRAVTASSGGRLAGTFFLTWLWGNMAPTSSVALDYSYDGGTNWIRIASNQTVSAARYLWESTQPTPAISPIAKWRLVKEADTNVTDETDRTFALNGPFSFFVNDTSTVADVYTSAAGADGNLGIFSNAPKASLGNLLDAWDLEGGDTVYIDAGSYAINTNDVVNLINSDSGLEGDPVNLIGSGAGTVLEWVGNPATQPGLVNLLASHARLGRMAVRKGGIRAEGNGLVLQELSVSNGFVTMIGSDIAVSNLTVTAGTVQSLGTNINLRQVAVQNGVFNLGGRFVNLLNSLAWGSSTQLMLVSGSGITLSNNTLVSANTAVVLDGADASLKLRNNILVANGADKFIVRRDRGALDSDYNNLVARNGAWFGRADGQWERLLYWQRASGQDANSVSIDPLFADEAGGDFHLKSVMGRYTPSGVVTDLVHSPVIDLGNPADGFAAEPIPNGGRLNLGAYGNTFQASRSRTNKWVLAVTLNDGGVFRGTNTLRWAAGNLTGGETVTLRYSPDGGATWTNIAAGLPAGSGQYLWDSTSFTSSLDAVWGVLLDEDTNIADQVDTAFALRNNVLQFFVNDAEVANDVYASAPGHATNSGLTAGSPKLSVQGILDAYDTEGGDIIYVDSGFYPLTSDINVIWSRGGDAASGQMWIWGSTNFAAGGTRLSRGSVAVEADVLEINASYVAARNLTLQNGYRGLLSASNRQVVLERSLVVSNLFGATVRNTTNVLIRNNRFWHNTNGAVEVLSSYSNAVENNTLVANQPWSIRAQGSVPLSLQNNIVVLSVSNAAVYAGALDNVLVDYNVYHFTAPGVIFGSTSNLLTWQLATRHDYRSASLDPALADAAGGDFHLRSSVGRWLDGVGWTTDVENSWAIDKGATNVAYALEPEPNGARVNIGAYGNTEYASQGRESTNYYVEARILNEETFISETNATWPLIWTSINVPTTETFRVEYSPDNGVSWYVLSNNVPAYQEVFLWNVSPFFNTYHGRWRVVGIGNTNYWDINDNPFQLFFGEFKITELAELNVTNRVKWRGAWAENYRVQYSTNLLDGTNSWFDGPSGVGPNQQAVFLSTNGGDFFYEDVGSPTNRFRLYRIIQD